MRIVSLIIALSCTCLAAAESQDSEIDRGTLVGLDGVGVQIALTADELPPGLTEDRLRVAVELRLRQGGIQVLSRDKLLSAPGYPDLALICVVIANQNQMGTRTGYTYAFTLQLLQSVRMERDLAITHVEGMTWHAPLSLGTSAPSEFVGLLIGDVEAEVDRFINAYLASNGS